MRSHAQVYTPRIYVHTDRQTDRGAAKEVQFRDPDAYIFSVTLLSQMLYVQEKVAGIEMRL
jgi:hypothetical protein